MSGVMKAAAFALMIVFAQIAGAQMKTGGLFTSGADDVLTLVGVDSISHTALLRNHDGASLRLDVPAEAEKMRQAKPGTLFRMRLTESLGFEVEPDRSPGTFEEQTVELVAPGEPPAIEVVTTKRIALTVQSIDTVRGQVTLQDGQNTAITFTYTGHNMDEVVAGDTFSLLHIETLTLEMMPDRMQTSR